MGDESHAMFDLAPSTLSTEDDTLQSGVLPPSHCAEQLK
jgi:hypothetical protein